jgi:polar amino acid transport system substrate-binding protein
MSSFSIGKTLSVFGVFLGLTLCATLAQADATLDKIQQRHKISIGVILSGPPFGTIDPKTGELDILIANMQYTDERAEILDYVPTPYEEVGGAALIRKGAGISKWEDLKGKPVCVSQGSNFIKPLQETYGAQIKAFRSQSESLLSLRGNGCVAAVHVSPTMHALLDDPEWADYNIPLASDLIPSKSVIWVRKGEHDTQAKLDAIIRDWHRSGWLIEVGERTGMAPSQALRDLHEQFRNAAPLAAQ